jgi:hypothetical protein
MNPKNTGMILMSICCCWFWLGEARNICRCWKYVVAIMAARKT